MNSVAPAEMPQEVGKNRVPLAAAGAMLGLAGGVAVYLQMGKEHPTHVKEASLLPYCEDIVRELDDYQYAIVGGMPIDAFNDDKSVIDVEARTITVADTFDSKLIRSNDSVRDYDIFLLGRTGADQLEQIPKKGLDEAKRRLVKAAEKRAKQNGTPVPEMSVFSFDDKPSLFHTATLLHEDGTVSLQHGFTERTLPEGTLQTWTLILPGDVRVSILDPREQFWRSEQRFPSGRKKKDEEKLDKMQAKLAATPGLDDMDTSPLYVAHREYHGEMLRGASRNALNDEWYARQRDWDRVRRCGTHVLAKRVLEVGQESQAITAIVQSTPKVFNLFSGGG